MEVRHICDLDAKVANGGRQKVMECHKREVVKWQLREVPMASSSDRDLCRDCEKKVHVLHQVLPPEVGHQMWNANTWSHWG
jgi:hypothetical protein